MPTKQDKEKQKEMGRQRARMREIRRQAETEEPVGRGVETEAGKELQGAVKKFPAGLLSTIVSSISNKFKPDFTGYDPWEDNELKKSMSRLDEAKARRKRAGK